MPEFTAIGTRLRPSPTSTTPMPARRMVATTNPSNNTYDTITSARPAWLATCSTTPTTTSGHSRKRRSGRWRGFRPSTTPSKAPATTAASVNHISIHATVRPMADEVIYATADGVARITINRPERRNAMSWGVISGIRDAVAEAKDDADVRVIVLTGAGDKAFCAGADLTGMRADSSYLEVHDGRGQLAKLFNDFWALGKPTIARVRGFALAGGFGLALSCDLVVAADDAQFGTPEINVGLWPYMITVPLTRSMPPKIALELMMTGRRVAAEEARAIGFVNRVVAVDELDGAVA